MVLDVAAVVGPDGWITWEALTGRLVSIQPGVYASGAVAGEWRIRVEAAVRSRRAVASHRTALALWGLLPPGGPIHVTVEPGRSNRGSAGVVLHRARDLRDLVRNVGGVHVTSVERAIVDSWVSAGDAGRPAVRAAAITAARRRMCGPRELAQELDRRPQLPDRSSLAELVQLLADGCQSELEIWGCVNVLRAPGMPPFTQQRRLTVSGEVFWLDAAYDEALLAVEMDGAAWHGSRDQRERDIRRDALVATAGWQTLRFSFARLTRSPDDCRRDIRSVHAARLRLLGGGGAR